MLAAGGTQHYSDGGVRRYLPDLFPYQKLRMSRQDIRDEYKQMEGDPTLRAVSGRCSVPPRVGMMEDVPKADVIVTNPTHYSVALQYDENKMSAPKVVAKGPD